MRECVECRNAQNQKCEKSDQSIASVNEHDGPANLPEIGRKIL